MGGGIWIILGCPVRSVGRTDGTRLWLKTENLQRGGSFKVRGALLAVEQLAASGSRGVIAQSTGNHAIAVALAAREYRRHARPSFRRGTGQGIGASGKTAPTCCSPAPCSPTGWPWCRTPRAARVRPGRPLSEPACGRGPGHGHRRTRSTRSPGWAHDWTPWSFRSAAAARSPAPAWRPPGNVAVVGGNRRPCRPSPPRCAHSSR